MKKVYTGDVTPEFGIPFPEWLGVEKGELMCNLPSAEVDRIVEEDPDRAKMMLELIQNHNAWMREDPLEWMFTFESWRNVLANWHKYRTHIVFGGNRCLHGDEEIFDPVNNLYRKVSEIDSPHHVVAWNGEREVVCEAGKPFIKGFEQMIRVTLSNGESFKCSGRHQILGDNGYRSVSSFLKPTPEVSLSHLLSTLDKTLLEFVTGVHHLRRRVEDCLDDCSSCRHQYGEQLHRILNFFQSSFPSQSDAPEHSKPDEYIHFYQDFCSLFYELLDDDLVRKFLHSQNARLFSLLSTLDDLLQSVDLCADSLFHAFYKPCKLALQSHEDQVSLEGVQLSFAASSLLRSMCEFYLRDNQCFDLPSSYSITSHKDVKIESVEYLQEGSAVWDFEVPTHHNYVHKGIVHHNSSKSSFAAPLMVWLAKNIPEAELRCFHVNSDRSITDQQTMVWDCLDAGLKQLQKKKSHDFSVQYSQKNGFSDNKLILPPQSGYNRGSYIYFNNYAQYFQDAQVAEGYKCHAIWADEEIPNKLANTLLSRLTDYQGKLILTFTTLQGWTDLVSELLQGAKTVKTRYSDYVGADLPVMQESRKWADTAIYYFWTKDNPFVNYKDLERSFSGQTLDVKLARLHGVPTKTFQNRFPKFNPAINVIAHDDLPFVKDPKYKVTRYHICDPAGKKPWYMIWAAVDRKGNVYVYAEYPDISMGEWGLPYQNNAGKPIGKSGPAQRPNGWGYEQYKSQILDVERDTEVFERIMDSRMAKHTRQGSDGATDILTEMSKIGIYYKQSSGAEEDHGLSRINDYLAWNSDVPMSENNRPRLYFSDRCVNTIECMKEYSGVSREEVWKDGVDCVRYLLMEDPIYVGEGLIEITGGGSY